MGKITTLEPPRFLKSKYFERGRKSESQIMVRVARIELASPAWEADVLPLYYTRKRGIKCKIFNILHFFRVPRIYLPIGILAKLLRDSKKIYSHESLFFGRSSCPLPRPVVSSTLLLG